MSCSFGDVRLLEARKVQGLEKLLDKRAKHHFSAKADKQAVCLCLIIYFNNNMNANKLT